MNYVIGIVGIYHGVSDAQQHLKWNVPYLLPQCFENFLGTLVQMLKTGKFLGKEFRTGRGLTQGDTTLPIIFNILVDKVVRKVLDMVC